VWSGLWWRRPRSVVSLFMCSSYWRLERSFLSCNQNHVICNLLLLLKWHGSAAAHLLLHGSCERSL
jgi:hypothetical protein